MKWPEDFIDQIICGDCLEIMKGIPDNCVDTIITDPPYGLEFMGKEWDKLEPARNKQRWKGKERKLLITKEGQPESSLMVKKNFSVLPIHKPKRNPKCKKCGHYLFSGTPCKCKEPDWDYRNDEHNLAMQQWHYNWAIETLRIVKPGATLLCFGGTRTYHRLACAIEDAGWILKDCIMWVYGSGFPKASDISRMLDKAECRSRLINILGRKPTQKEFREAWEGKKCTVCGGIGKAINPNVKDPELADYWLNKPCRKCNGSGIEQKGFREIIGKYELPDVADGKRKKGWECTNTTDVGAFGVSGQQDITTPATPEATLWDGWKSHGLKPAYEPILVAMKPNEGSYANNALKYGVAGLNIDGGRIGYNSREDEYHRDNKTASEGIFFKEQKDYKLNRNSNNKGRFPANVILDEESAKLLDRQAPKTGAFAKVKSGYSGKSKGIYHDYAQRGDNGETFYNDGLKGASRFFYCAKASKAERNKGCEGLPNKLINTHKGKYRKCKKCGKRAMSGTKEQIQYRCQCKNPDWEIVETDSKIYITKNNHPTVKPLALMKYLCTLTKTPTGGIVFDPFCGSGTTLMACKELKRSYIGIDNIPEYCEIARKRVSSISEPLF